MAKLAYVGDEDNWSRYTVRIENRRAFDVLIDNGMEVGSAELPEGMTLAEGVSLHRILIARVDAPVTEAQPTKGLASKVPHLDGNGVHRHIDSATVRSYVLPRTATLLARLFVPAAV